MQQPTDPSSEIVGHAKSRVERISARLLHLLEFISDDKLTWAPSPTAKSSLRIAAHCAVTNRSVANIVNCDLPEAMPSPAEFFQRVHEAEETITTRQAAIALFKETSALLCTSIGAVNAINIDSAPNSPFGPMPMRFWLELAHDHMAGHMGQIEYLQTVWGDVDNHVG